VSDTSVLQTVTSFGGRVLLCDRLHGKYFRSDERILVGSANLTAAGLGWSMSPNLELLVEVSEGCAPAIEFEQAVLDESVVATLDHAKLVDAAAEAIGPLRTGASLELSSASQPLHFSPALREPRDLYRAYAEGLDVLAESSRTAAAADLEALSLPVGLSRESFRTVVAARLLQLKVVEAVESAIRRDPRFGAARQALSTALDLEGEEATRAWQTLMRWLLEFVPGRYQRTVPAHSELMLLRDQS
jgi:phosphatidylserine/phosphatidylglycerophosphate/cardiolipin synthase-like enzyme